MFLKRHSSPTFYYICEEKRRLDNENKGFCRGEIHNISNWGEARG